ncbi:MAG: class I SAM-dependent methyltransferase [Armatimonas sp.]
MSRSTHGLTEPVQNYIATVGIRATPVQTALRDATSALPQAGMQICPEQGHFMSLLIKLIGAKRCIEVGTFTGYSALMVAQALPDDGLLVCCDISDEFTSVGKPFWKEAGVDSKIDLRLAPGTETLDALLADGQAGTYDFGFIDADKPGYDSYYERVLELVRPGGLIGVDNTIWYGRVADPDENDADTTALKTLNQKIHDDERVDMVLLPIGDGLTLCRKR